MFLVFISVILDDFVFFQCLMFASLREMYVNLFEMFYRERRFSFDEMGQ
jgi:hypothetical protein